MRKAIVSIINEILVHNRTYKTLCSQKILLSQSQRNSTLDNLLLHVVCYAMRGEISKPEDIFVVPDHSDPARANRETDIEFCDTILHDSVYLIGKRKRLWWHLFNRKFFNLSKSLLV